MPSPSLCHTEIPSLKLVFHNLSLHMGPTGLPPQTIRLFSVICICPIFLGDKWSVDWMEQGHETINFVSQEVKGRGQTRLKLGRGIVIDPIVSQEVKDWGRWGIIIDPVGSSSFASFCLLSLIFYLLSSCSRLSWHMSLLGLGYILCGSLLHRVIAVTGVYWSVRLSRLPVSVVHR